MTILRRIVTVPVVCAVGLAGAPAALAVSPPPVDDALLPKPGPPAPPRPTEQAAPCVNPLRDREVTRAGAQLAGLDLPTVWRLTRGASQTVAVIDTGVSPHPMLPRLIPGGDYVAGGDGTEDCDGHGTVIAGIVAASADSTAGAFTGVAPDATVISIRQSSNKFRPVDQPAASGFGDVETLAMAVRTAADLGATVINVSSVACVPVADALDDRSLGAALSYAVDVKNVVVVAAAGNVGAPGQCPDQNPVDPAAPNRPDWDNVRVVVSPAWYDDFVLTVGSVAPDGTPSPFSLAGPWVDVAAPGEEVVSLDPDGDGLVDALSADTGPAPLAGTSYAAPVVTGIAALIRSRWPQLSARQVMRRIEDTARPPAGGWNAFLGHGVVDPLAAVSGGSEPLLGETETRRVTVAPPSAADPHPRRIAFTGAAVCIAVAGVVLLAAAARRSGRDAVPQD